MTAARPRVPLLVPELPDRHALAPWLDRMDAARQYSNFGPLTAELEGLLAQRFAAQADHPVAVTTVSSATLGLELALAALGLPAGSRVLVPAFTFVATATAVLRAGLVPVIGDVDAGSWMLTPALAEAVLQQQAFEAVLPVAAFGMAHDAAEWASLSARRGLPVIIDAAGAFGGQWITPAAQRTARADLTVVFSLHTTKSLPAGEGGLVVSNNAERIRDIRQRSNFGINLDPSRGVPVGVSDVLGTNAKLSEYHAAVGLASLARWDERAAARRTLMDRYAGALHDASLGALLPQQGPAIAAPTLLCVRWPGHGHADRLEHLCGQAGVMTRRWYQPLLHSHPFIQGHALCLPTPVADRIAPELIGLPFFPSLGSEQIALVADCVARTARSVAQP